MPPCICDFPSDCGGLGMLLCGGCGGDLCVCECGGAIDCAGCDCCRDRNEEYPYDERLDEDMPDG